MNIEPQNQGNLASSNSSDFTSTSGPSSKISNFFEQVHSVSALHFISALLQIGLGLSVVVAAVIGLIQPFWASTVMSMFASITCMVGLFLLYSITHAGGHEQLVRDAMRRIMNAQN